MLAYLAGPIDFCGDTPVVDEWRALALGALIDAGFAVYDPARPFRNAMVAPRSAHAINTAAIANADALMAVLPPGVPSVGTPMEIADAHRLGRGVVVIGAQGSMQLNGMGIHCYHPDHAGKAAVHLREISRNLKLSYPNDREIRWTGEPELEPRRKYPGDAGYDLVVDRDTTVRVDSFVDVPCGVCVEMPPDTWGLIIGRSSTLRRRGLLVTQGVIDNGYRGELFAGVQHLNQGPPVELKRGERIAQFIPFRLEAPSLRLRRVAELGDSDRGAAGFGSTGE